MTADDFKLLTFIHKLWVRSVVTKNVVSATNIRTLRGQWLPIRRK